MLHLLLYVVSLFKLDCEWSSHRDWRHRHMVIIDIGCIRQPDSNISPLCLSESHSTVNIISLLWPLLNLRLVIWNKLDNRHSGRGWWDGLDKANNVEIISELSIRVWPHTSNISAQNNNLGWNFLWLKTKKKYLRCHKVS